MRKIILSLVIVLSTQYLVAQKAFQEFDFFQNGAGVTLGNVFALEFDDSNNVWMGGALRKFPRVFGGGNGLYKFDGTDIIEINNSIISPTTPILSLLFHNNKLWIGTKINLVCFNKSKNTWKEYTTITGQINAIKYFNDTLYVGAGWGGNKYYKMDLATEKVSEFPIQDGVYDLAVEDNGTVWLATPEGLIQDKNKQLKKFDMSNSVLSSNDVRTVTWNKVTKQLWVGVNNYLQDSSEGLFVVSNDILYTVKEAYPCASTSIYKFIGIQDIAQDNDGNIYVNGPKNFFRGNRTISKISTSGYSNFNINTEWLGKIQPLEIDMSSPITFKFDSQNRLWLYSGFVDRLFRINKVEQLPRFITNNLIKNDDDKPQNLNINQVDAWMLNRGDMFWDNGGNNGYFVPKGSCKSPLLAASLWIGGKDANNKIHLAAMEYRFNGADYSPGPLDTITIKGDTTGKFTKIWKVSKWEVEEFKQKFSNGDVTSGAYTPYDDFMNWPANGSGGYARNLAPFVDVDNNNIYEPLKGDYPKIKGEETVYWIFNDNTYPHTENVGGVPFGIEVHAMAYAYNCDTIQKGSPNEALNYTTFYEYRIINRSDTTYDSTYVGLWVDPDLGNPNDDFVGSNKTGNFAFTYNADNDDETHKGYGKNPPMLSTVFLSDTMHSFLSYKNDFSVVGMPILFPQKYNYLKGFWRDDSPLTFGGSGYKTGAPTKLMYPGTPYTNEWVDSGSFQNGNRRYIQSAGPFTLAPKQEKIFSYAIVYSHEPNAPNGLNTSWAKNLRDVNTIKGWYNNQNFPSCPTKPIDLSIGSEVENPLQEIKAVPNPFNGTTSLVFNLSKETKGTIKVYNMLGQVVQSIPLTRFNLGENTVSINIASHPAGMYMYVLKTEGGQYAGKIIKE